MTNVGGYEVRYYDNHEHFDRCKDGTDYPKILHNPTPFDNKLSSGKIIQSINAINSFEFSIAYNHQYYSDINFIVGLVEVINLIDNEREFIGRVLSIAGEMSDSGFFSKTYVCEDFLGYLHDSAQYFQKIINNGPRRYLTDIIGVHNNQVESHKRFWIRKVDIENTSDTPHRYVAYDDTFETIKTYILERMGGYLTLSVERRGLFLSWTKKIGQYVDSPIQLGQNIKSAQREINPEGLITRLVPVGADKDDSTGRDEETGQYITRERVTIESVNGGVRYLEDSDLVKEFGIIQKSVDWTEISNPSILKKRGQQYLDNQKLAVASWTLDTVELYIVDPLFKKYKVGNTHPINNPPMAGAEKLQIIEKEIDILSPQSVKLKIGSSNQTLSMYQLQQQEAKNSMQRVVQNEAAARRKAEQQLEAKQQELVKVQEQLRTKIEIVNKENNIANLKSSLLQNQNLLKSEEETLASLQEELSRLRNLGTNQDIMISFISLQIDISQNKISNYRTLINEIELKINELNSKKDKKED